MTNSLLYGVAITALAVSDMLLVLLGMLAYRLYHRAEEQAVTPDVGHEELRQNLKALAVSMSLLGERLARLESQLGRLQEQGEQRSLPSHQEAGHNAFEVATKMVLQGADVEALVNLCGLTRGEAELIHMLHGGGKQDRQD